MSELVWPVVAVIGMVLVFIRTRPNPNEVNESVEMMRLAARVLELESAQKESTPKALVDRVNLLSKEMAEVIKPRLLAVEEVAGELKTKVQRFESAAAAKSIAGLKQG